MVQTFARHEFAFQIVAAGFIGLAACSMGFAYAYAADTAAFLSSPGQIWAYVCGAPLQSTATTPILVGVSSVSALVGAGLLYLRARALAS
ncbi:MAG: hypothetical protein RLZZ297_615 [Chloroflexota bacterium]|jgi:hypothetical protein